MSTGIQTYERPSTELMEQPPQVETIAPSSIQIRAEIDAQIATARAFPRSITKALRDAETLATIRPEVAAACIYAVPRDGKTIEGPSARLAEILASSWGNLRVTGRITEETDRYIVAVGQCIDLERNNGRQVEVRRRITDRKGRRYSDDMIVTTCNAAIAIATRNAILAVVPRALWDTVYQAARQAAVGNLDSIEQVREGWLAYWGKKGVKHGELFAALDIRGKEDITLDHIATMVGWQTALKEHETTIEEIFRPAAPVVSQKAETLTQALKDAKGKTKAQDLPYEPGANG